MELLSTAGLRIERGGRRLLDGAELTLRSGDRIGLAAPNGSGKSTLLALLAGVPAPDAELDGSVRRAPGVRLRYLPQGGGLAARGSVADAAARALAPLRELERELRAEEARLAASEAPTLTRYGELTSRFERLGGYRADAALWASLERLGIPEAWRDRPLTELSGGERKRLALGLALAERSDLLLLDEPTTHLDLPARRALEALLADLPPDAALLTASHDRAFLDASTRSTLFLQGGTLRREAGGYSAAAQRRAAQGRGAARRAREAGKRVERLQSSVAELRRQGHRGAQTRRKRLERELDDALELAQRDAARPPSALELPLGAADGRGGGLRAEHLTALGLFDGVALRLDPGERLALFGANGSGKSTLLRMLAGEIDGHDPRVERSYRRGTRLLHLDQRRRGLADGTPLVVQLERFVFPDRARELLSRAGVPPSRWSALPETLSGGERGRAGLALVAAAEANLLLLDEPEADLDIDALEALEALLADSDATVLLATHDRALAAAVATRVAALAGGAWCEYRGGVEGYLAGRRRREAGSDAPLPSNRPAPEEGPEARAGNDREDDAVTARLEDALADLDTALLDPLAWSERELERLHTRQRALLDALSLRYDARYPAPAPRHSVPLAGIRWGLEPDPDAPATAPRARVAPLGATPAPLAVALALHGDVAHASLRPAARSDALPWGAALALTAAVRLAFEAYAPRAIQAFAPPSAADGDPAETAGATTPDLAAALAYAGFHDAGAGWWLLERSSYEARTGVVRSRRRRLRHPRRWRSWSAARRSRSGRDG